MELFSLFEKGGLVMYPLLICSIAAIAILIERIRTYNNRIKNNHQYHRAYRFYLYLYIFKLHTD